MNTFQPSDKKRKRIFVFDRSESIRDAFSLLFKETHDFYGFSSIVDIASQPDMQPDIIVIDIPPMMHTTEVAKIIEILKNMYKRIPIIIMSTNKNIFNKAAKFGIKNFLEKPFGIDLLQQQINTLVR